MNYNTIVIGGAGSNLFIYMGAIRYLETLKNVLPKIKKFICASAGALIGLLSIVGYSSSDMYQIFMYCKCYFCHYFKITVENVIDFFDNFGLIHHCHFITIFYFIIKHKVPTITETTTFEELFIITNVDFHIIGCCVDNRENHDFNHLTSPSMCIWKAIAITISIPFFFCRIQYDKKLYIDGAFYINCPIHFINNKTDNCIIFSIKTTKKSKKNTNQTQKYGITCYRSYKVS
jgi:predicted acylesterase/phospholipase RssA